MFGGGVGATRCGFEFFGVNQVVFATDTPLGPIAPTIATVKSWSLSGGRTKDFLLKRREIAEHAILLELIRLLLPFDIRRAGDTGKTWRVARRKAVVGTVHDLVFLALIPRTLLLDTFANPLVKSVAPAVFGFGHFLPPQKVTGKVSGRPREFCEFMCR
jgi:hypothetical protein